MAAISQVDPASRAPTPRRPGLFAVIDGRGAMRGVRLRPRAFTGSVSKATRLNQASEAERCLSEALAAQNRSLKS